MKISQLQQVENILLREGKIDNFFAIDTRLTLRLGDIIFKLRNKGYEIQTDTTTKNTVYKLISKPCTTYSPTTIPAPTPTSPTPTAPESFNSGGGSGLRVNTTASPTLFTQNK